MIIHTRLLVVSAICLAQIGCTTIKSYDTPLSRTEVFRILKSGDKVTILASAGKSEDLKLTAVGTDWIEGSAEGSNTVARYGAGEIQSIQRSEPDALKSLALVAAVVAVIAIIATAAVNSFASALASVVPAAK
jgi:hypothetical protein